MDRYSEIMEQWKRLRVLVLGDVMLDRYVRGQVSRISPEAPVPVLHSRSREVRLGGAASVACLAAGLGAEVWIAGVTGEDQSGRELRTLLIKQGIHLDFLLSEADRPTTTKLRLLGGVGHREDHHLLRVDEESSSPLSARLEAHLIEKVTTSEIPFDAILVSDYRKGVCSPRLLQAVLQWGTRQNIPSLADPANGSDWRYYAGADLIKPNRHEAEQFTGIRIDSPHEAMEAARQICQRVGTETCLITLDAEGMVLAEQTGFREHFPSSAREVKDVTGAGDMVLAVMGLGLAAQASWTESTILANTAAGWEVEQWGVTPLSPWRLLRELQPQRNSSLRKLVDLAALKEEIRAQRDLGKTIVFTNGCFDLLHPGHLHCLQEASRQGAILIVAINSDESIRRLKGPTRPLIPQQHRAALLCALEEVDHVLIFEEDTPHRLLEELQPDVLVKGGTTAEVVGAELLTKWRGRVYTTAPVAGYSTTQLVEQLFLFSH